MARIDIGVDFSPDPLGRFRSDGDFSGEAFREDFLVPAIRNLKAGEKLTLVLDNQVESYGSSFLTEGFAGIVKYGYLQANDLLSKIEFEYSNPDFMFYKQKIIQYCNQAKFNSRRYEPTLSR